MDTPFSLWVYLATTPLTWLTLTIAAWLLAVRIATLAKGHPVVNPVLIAILLVGGLLIATGTSYETYFKGAQFVHFLLGPTTVAIAVPLYRNRAIVRRNLLPMLVALVAGALVAVTSALAIGAVVGLPKDILVALAPKSVTAGVAMAITERLGGAPSVTAILVIATGILGAIIVTPLMNAMRITDYAARGFSVGLASHGIGTARAFHVDPIAGLFAGIAMGLNAIVTSILVPIIVHYCL